VFVGTFGETLDSFYTVLSGTSRVRRDVLRYVQVSWQLIGVRHFARRCWRPLLSLRGWSRHLGNSHCEGRIRFRIHCRTASPDFDFAENGRRRASRRTSEDGHDNSIPWCTVLNRRTESILRTVLQRKRRQAAFGRRQLRVRPSGIVTTIVTMGAYACTAATALSIATRANAIPLRVIPPSLCFRMPLTPPSQGLGGDRHVADVATE